MNWLFGNVEATQGWMINIRGQLPLNDLGGVPSLGNRLKQGGRNSCTGQACNNLARGSCAGPSGNIISQRRFVLAPQRVGGKSSVLYQLRLPDDLAEGRKQPVVQNRNSEKTILGRIGPKRGR